MIQQILERALMYHQQGRAAEAEALYRQLLSRDAKHADAWHLMGLLSLQLGDAKNAVRRIGKAVRFAPDQAMYLNSLGEAHRAFGQFEEAVKQLQAALNLQPDYPEAHNNLGNAHKGLGDLVAAVVDFQRALTLKPDYFNARHNLGVTLLEMGDPEAAIPHLEQALTLQADNGDTLNGLGCALAQVGRTDEGVDTLNRALTLDPDRAMLHYNLGDLLRGDGRLPEAADSYQRAVELEPDNLVFQNNLAATRKALGDMEGAKALFKEILAIDPLYHEARRNLSQCQKYGEADRPEMEWIEKFLRQHILMEEDRISLHFTLGKMWDDCGDHDRGFEHYRQANRFKHQQSRFDRQRHQALIDRLMAVFDEPLFAARRAWAIDDERPVFIVGMPRSGTTLVEQILSSHPQLFGADELNKISLLAEGLAKRAGKGETDYPECVPHLDESTIGAVAREYGAFLEKRSGGGFTRVSDKMPYNYLHLGLIALLFRNPRIIHCQRDPVDTGLSIFFQNFSSRNPTNDYADDLAEIGFYHRQYQRLMAHWRRVLPVSMFELPYEALIADREGKTRALIDFVGLPWFEGCLTPHETKRPVQTASGWQVRQPIYSSSVNRWKRYERHLRPLLEALGGDYAPQ